LESGGIEDGSFVSQADHQPVIILPLDLDLNLAWAAIVSVDDDVGGCFVDRLDTSNRFVMTGAQQTAVSSAKRSAIRPGI
jgi:hypothetical protein